MKLRWRDAVVVLVLAPVLIAAAALAVWWSSADVLSVPDDPLL